MPYNTAEFAAEIKRKYPEYSDWEDGYLVGELTSKYPEYKEWVSQEPPQPSHLPQRIHDQEKNYSPVPKQTGGYSYAPPTESEEDPFAKPAEPKKYQPDFLAPFEMPAESQEEQPLEEPMPEQEAIETEQVDKSNDRSVTDEGIKKYPAGNGKWVDAKGRAVKPPRR